MMKRRRTGTASFILMASVLLPGLPAPTLARSGGDLESLFSSQERPEAAFHSRTIPTHAELGGADDSRDLAGFIPECGPAGTGKLPTRYAEEYSITLDGKTKLQAVLNVMKKYSSAERALADGYAPVDFYESGLGVAFARTDLLTDGRYDLGKPDLLFYVKERDRAVFRIAGAAFVAGSELPRNDFLITRKGTREIMRLWRPWEDICFKRRDGLLSYQDSEDGKTDCARGELIRKAWIMHVWLPLYNPKGLFTPRNPLVNYLDLTGQDFPFCRKRA
ncbi:MAG: hypothetical protein WC969_00905 [Elusimicrobiota bacterium]|jgi:hypothetical protein